MQSIADTHIVDTTLYIEIRSRWSRTPGSAPGAELQRLGLSLLEVSRILRLEGAREDLEPAHVEALVDPLAESASIAAPLDGSDGVYPLASAVDVFCRPGVTDAEGEMATLALERAGCPGVRCHAGLRYRFGGWAPREIRPAAERLLGNPLIHSFIWSGDLPVPIAARRSMAAVDPISIVDLRGFDDEELLAISRRFHLALDLAEMQAIARHYRSVGRAPTDVELQSLALTWSEHCSHKTFKATIHFQHGERREIIPGLLQTYIAAPTAALNRPWVRSAFVDNAGVIAFDDRYDLAVKVETHNHPSALEPFGGAHTGVGGVIRDVLAVSAEPIANTDVLCFGPLDGAQSHARGAVDPGSTYRGVVRGIADYGNNMGIPTVGGAILFHPGYAANPLVYCGTLGLAPAGSHPRQPQTGDAVVLLGGRTGRDGLHGATMSSETLDRQSVAGSAVQIGAPVTEKLLRDVLPRLRDERLYHAITDCGAGGLCSAIGEMGEGLGVEVDLALVPLKYEGLRPWEIWLSEAQERMVLAIPPASIPRLLALCREHDVEATVLGRFRDDRLLRIRYGNRLVADMSMAFLHTGRPGRVLQARWPRPDDDQASWSGREVRFPSLNPAQTLLDLLAHPNIASKEQVVRQYDHEVQAATVVKPLVGRAGPSNAAVLKPLPDSWRGVVVAHGINPLYTALDPHAMAMLAVDEALRNLVAVGGSLDGAALLDNFCWGDIDDPDELGALVRAVRGCRDAALAYGVPFVSGKDSLRNTSVDEDGKRSIPGTLLISAVGVMPDVRCAVTMDLKASGSEIYLLGLTRDELGGSHYLCVAPAAEGRPAQPMGNGGQIPRARPPETVEVMTRLSRAIRHGLILSCHDLSEGGLAVAAAEMALAGGLGLDLDLDRVPAETERVESLLFAESPGRFLVEVAPEHRSELERLFEGLPHAPIGQVLQDPGYTIRHAGDPIIDLPLTDIDTAWRGGPHPPAPSPSRGEGESITSVRRYQTRPIQDGRLGTAPAPIEPPSPLEGEGGWGGEGPPAMVLAAPGVNCDRETVEACRLAGAGAELVHLNQLLSGERKIHDFAMLILPGGFSYGDHLGAGSMLATTLRHRFLEDLQRFIADGRPVLGICNGFQVLARLGLLGPVALAPNVQGRFECRWVRLQVEPSPCIFLQGLESLPLDLPIAHGQGRLVAPEERVPGILPLAPLRYEDNPNGSVFAIAGVCNAAGNVFGLMPHPERYLSPYHHPDWTHRSPLPPLGLTIFQNAVRYVRRAL